jgi:tetrahydromethanopterin S-methyltransferase subunit H
MGLMGGLIASTILPMAQGYGQIAKQKIDNAKCGLPENTAAYFHCMNDSVNWVDRLAAKTLTTGTLLLAALAILVITAWLMRRVLKL